MTNFNRLLHTTTSLSVIAAALALSGALVVRMTDSGANGRDAGPYRAGEQLEPFAEAVDAVRPTLLLVVRSGCPFCTDSMGFYRSLAKRAQSDGVRTVALVNEPERSGAAYLARQALVVDRVISLPPDRLARVTMTPTIILVDRQGVVIQSWQGRLAKSQESDVMRALRSIRSGD